MVCLHSKIHIERSKLQRPSRTECAVLGCRRGPSVPNDQKASYGKLAQVALLRPVHLEWPLYFGSPLPPFHIERTFRLSCQYYSSYIGDSEWTIANRVLLFVAVDGLIGKYRSRLGKKKENPCVLLLIILEDSIIEISYKGLRGRSDYRLPHWKPTIMLHSYM